MRQRDDQLNGPTLLYEDGMTFREAAGLIPRNNWDYGLGALVTAASGLRGGAPGASKVVSLFEREPIWTNAGRTSLFAILRALDLPPGAEVGVPLFCCSVVFNAIRQAGLTPRFIDSSPEDYNLCIEDLQRKRAGLRAVVPVHMFGNPADMDAITAVADGVPVIEDCAQSLFSTYKGRMTGTLSAVSFFSFRCGKYISAGEGSAILCGDANLRERIGKLTASFRPWSRSSMAANMLVTYAKATLYNRPWYGLVGYPVGTRLDKKLNLTAKDGFEAGQIAATQSVLIDKRVRSFRNRVDQQRRHARMLLESITPGEFELPDERPDRERNWFQFPLRFRTVEQRDRMARHLLAHGIDTAKYLSDIAGEARDRYGYTGDCPNAEQLSQTTLLVPIHYNLHLRDLEHIAYSINEGSRIV